MLEHDLLDLDRRDVLAAADDDVLRAILNLQIPVRVQDRDVTRMKVAARERLRGRGRIVVVTLHHVVATHDNLALRLRVARHVDERLRVVGRGLHDADVLGADGDHRHALARLHLCASGGVERVPLGLPRAHRDRSVRLGQSVDLSDRCAEGFHLCDRRRRGRRTGGNDVNRAWELLGFGMVRERDQDGRRAAEMRDALAFDQVEDFDGIDSREADVRRGRGGNGPWKAPAVAVEHRQRPEIDAVRSQVRVEDFGERILIRSAVCIHHTLRLAGRPARIIDRDGRIFVRQGVVDRRARGGRHERVEFGGIAVAADADPLDVRSETLDQRRKLSVVDRDARAAVPDDVFDLGLHQPDVQRAQDRTGERDGEVRFEECALIFRQHGDAVARRYTEAAQRMGEPIDAFEHLRIGAALVTVDDGDPLAKDERRALEKIERAQAAQMEQDYSGPAERPAILSWASIASESDRLPFSHMTV